MDNRGDRLTVTPPSRSSGDLLADRRFAYAVSLMDEDRAAAADLFLQTIERVPHWTPAWMALGGAYETLDRLSEAEAAFEQAQSLDPHGLFGASLHLARLRGDGAALAMPRPYVAALFDDYAPRFDRHLTGELGYRGPALLGEAVRAAAGESRFARAIDLGCGTGLMGAEIRTMVETLIGVDLSPAMIAEAARRGLYDALHVGEIGEVIGGFDAASCDLILAADVFVYLGALDDLIRGTARALTRHGLLAFTVQKSPGAAVHLGADLRFSHTADYIGQVLRHAGFADLTITEASTRREAGLDVPGLVVTARHTNLR